MEVIVYLIPLSLILGAIMIYCFFWALKNNQYEDLESPGERLLHIEERSDQDRTDPTK